MKICIAEYLTTDLESMHNKIRTRHIDWDNSFRRNQQCVSVNFGLILNPINYKVESICDVDTDKRVLRCAFSDARS